jgi:hypothetical protein
MPALAKLIAMPPPIVPAPMIPTLRIGPEDVAQRARLGCVHQRHETLALQAQRLVDRFADRHRHRFHALQRRRKILRRGTDRVARELQERFSLRVLHLEVAHALERQFVGHHLVGQRPRRRHRIAVDHVVEQRGAFELGRRDRRTRHDHVERRLQPDHPRQPLRAAGAGQQAELDFGQRDLRIGLRHAVVGAERQLQPAAHADTRDRSDHRLGRVFERSDQRRQPRLAQGIRRAEFLDIGATRERALAAGDDDRLHLGLGQCAIQRLHQALAQCGAQSVDRRMVQADQRGRTVHFVQRAAHRRPFNRVGYAPGVRSDRHAAIDDQALAGHERRCR